MNSIWVNKAASIQDAEKYDREYYSKMTSSERLETVQLLRETYFKIKKGSWNEDRKGLRRILIITKQE